MSTWQHGTAVGYVKHGCRCDECRKVRSEERLRRGQLPFEKVPHGTTNGYNNYCCRCEACKAAKSSEGRRLRAKRKGDRPENTPHGTPNGFSQWGCRCDECREAFGQWRNGREKAKNDQTMTQATRRYWQWTGPELEIATRGDLTAIEAAQMLGRTKSAVMHARARCLRDPRYMQLLGASRPGHSDKEH